MILRHGKWFGFSSLIVKHVRPLVRGSNNFHTALGRERDRVSVSEVQASDLKSKTAAIWVIDPWVMWCFVLSLRSIQH